jgi:hypothetical protein
MDDYPEEKKLLTSFLSLDKANFPKFSDRWSFTK